MAAVSIVWLNMMIIQYYCSIVGCNNQSTHFEKPPSTCQLVFDELNGIYTTDIFNFI